METAQIAIGFGSARRIGPAQPAAALRMGPTIRSGAHDARTHPESDWKRPYKLEPIVLERIMSSGLEVEL